MYRLNKLKQWIADGENNTVDFKQSITSAPKIARNIVAFANSRGGRILVGVEDKGRITGVEAAEEQFELERAAEKFCDPPITISYEIYHIEGKKVLIAEVPESRRKPHFAIDKNGQKKIFVRLNDTCLEPTPTIETVLRRGDLNGIERRESVYNQLKKELQTYFETHTSINFVAYQELKKCSEKSAQRSLTDLLLTGFLRQIDDNTFVPNNTKSNPR